MLPHRQPSHLVCSRHQRGALQLSTDAVHMVILQDENSGLKSHLPLLQTPLVNFKLFELCFQLIHSNYRFLQVPPWGTISLACASQRTQGNPEFTFLLKDSVKGYREKEEGWLRGGVQNPHLPSRYLLFNCSLDCSVQFNCLMVTLPRKQD